MSSAVPAQVVPPPTAPQMRPVERWLFATGDIFGGGAAATLNVLYLFYLTDIVGLPPGLAGTTIVVSKIWDAINHPLMGVITDRTRSRWGRRRPWIFVGSLLLPPAMAALWAPIGDWTSQTAKVWFVIVAHLLWTTVASIVAVPYGSLSTEVTTDVAERNRVNILRLGFATFSGVGCTVVLQTLIKAFTDGAISSTVLYVSLFAGFGTFFSLPLVLVAIFTHERAPVAEHVDHLDLRVVVSPFRIASFRHLTWMYLCPSLTIDITTSVVVFYVLNVVYANPTVFSAVFAAVSLVLLPLLMRVVGTVDKARIYRVGLPVSIVAVAGIALYPRHTFVWPVYVFAGLFAVGVAAAQIMVWVIFPDVVDDGELQQGARNAGSFSGVMVLVRTAASAVATFVVGWVLDLTGYRHVEPGRPRPPQPDSALWGIRLTMLISVVVLLGIAWWVALRFPLSRERMAQIDADLDEARIARHAVAAEHPADPGHAHHLGHHGHPGHPGHHGHHGHHGGGPAADPPPDDSPH